MTAVTVPWRPSGGRGEFEYRPAEALADRIINLYFEPLALTIPAEVTAEKKQGKPRLRKFEKDNRKKLHLPQLVMAVARLPQPGRQDKTGSVSFPLENKSFVIREMVFDIIDDDGLTATLAPLSVSILHAERVIDLEDRFKAIASDISNFAAIAAKHPELANAIKAHGDEIMKGVNSADIKKLADGINELQVAIFGMTNAGSATKLEEADSAAATDLEDDLVGIEGRILTRIHAYKERDRKFAERAKNHYRKLNGGKLLCEACGLDPIALYGPEGERCIEAHHKVPIEELQPDSITRVDEMAMVCASCHRIIHKTKPCLLIQQVVPSPIGA